jgi:acyl-CoA synthetase (AMP-forming)/AMP-acid ligase II
MRQVLAITGAIHRHIAIPLQTKTAPAEVEFFMRSAMAAALITAPGCEAEIEAALGTGAAILIARSGQPPTRWEIVRQKSAAKISAPRSAAILYLVTSATTGSSKLVPLTAKNIDAGAITVRDAAQMTAADRYLLIVPMCHILGLECVFMQFLVGGAILVTEGFDPTAYLGWLRDLRPTWCSGTPALYKASLALLKHAPANGKSSLRVLFSAGAPLHNETRQELEAILGAPIHNVYGLSETGPIASEICFAGARVPNSVGRAYGVKIGIVDPAGVFLAPGEEGEIVARGASIFSGYADNPEANREAFIDDWFRTGDYGHLDEGENLFVTGRLKEIVNRGGEKVALEEVDAVLASHPAVQEAAGRVEDWRGVP